ncbi:MAG: hypothetical protein BWY76_03125 [bacterium ADurb.Bin429]|nr:MAG: hypothetical protein BWY76_03125 [bacterium ADurb.Bin429]
MVEDILRSRRFPGVYLRIAHQQHVIGGEGHGGNQSEGKEADLHHLAATSELHGAVIAGAASGADIPLPFPAQFDEALGFKIETIEEDGGFHRRDHHRGGGR